jgi:drug/metabolite transporter (DMT)-like permease
VSRRECALLPYAAFIALGLIWGGSFLFIKLALHDMGPTVIVLGRSAFGAITLTAIMLATRRPLFANLRARIWLFVFMAITNALVPWALIAWGEEHVSSGLASILNSTTTLWAAILIFFVIPNERPSRINYAGVLIGIVGVVILVLPDLTSHGVSGDLFGALAVVAASMSYAVSALFVRVRMQGMNVHDQSLGQLAATALIAIPVAAPSLPQVHLAWLSAAAVLALGIGGSGIAYLLYYYTMQTLGPVRATAVTFVVPITAVFWGVVLLKEPLTVATVLGMAVTLGGIVLTNLRRSPRRIPAEARESETAAA